jgi:ABC-type nitrate/sulfonate/bicarbonate transport system permease component
MASSPVVERLLRPDKPSIAVPPRFTGRGAAGVGKRFGIGLIHVVWPLALLYVAWAVWIQVGDIPPAVAPKPGVIVDYLSSNATSFISDAWQTIEVVFGGMLLGAVAGALLAGLSWFSPFTRAVISGPALLTQCLPIATITPVLARVFGYNTSTIVIITALIAFFPVLVFTTSGLRQTPAGSEDLFIVLGARRWQRFVRLAVPAAVPRILVSLRLSVVGAVAGALLAQWIMGTNGLGYRLVIAQSSFRTSEAWSSSVVAIALCVVLYALTSALCRLASDRFE